MLEIIAGKYRKRKIILSGKMRPPLQRMRVFIFDILSKYTDFIDKTVVDICAGTGSFGLECMSRGASYTYFIEEDKQTSDNLRSMINLWGADNASVLKLNVNYLPNSTVKPDLIFFDPPFGHTYILDAIKKMIAKQWIDCDTLLLLRTNYRFECDLSLLEYRQFGISHIYLYKGYNES